MKKVEDKLLQNNSNTNIEKALHKDIINKNKRIEQLNNKINDNFNLLNKKYNEKTTCYNTNFENIDNTLKSMSKQYVEVMNEEAIFNKIKEECSKFKISENINDIVSKKMYELNHDTMSSVTHRINDLQSQVTMIHQFNQTTYNMPKTYLFQWIIYSLLF